MTPTEYKRMTLSQLKGRKAYTIRPLESGRFRVPRGTLVTITVKYKGFQIETQPCKYCGVQVFMSRVEPYALDLMPQGCEESE